MSTYTSKLYIIVLFSILLILVAKPGVCIAGTRAGLLLWFNSVLPTLFPFFLITRIILHLNLCPKMFLKLFPFATGLIAGYPTGAITVCDQLLSGILTYKEGMLLLIMSNNASPGFLIAYTGSLLCLCNPYKIWFTVIISSIIAGMIYYISILLSKEEHKNIQVSNKATSDNSISNNHYLKHDFILFFEKTMTDCINLLVVIGCYIMIFSMLSYFITDLFEDNLLSLCFAGSFEITNGVSLLSKYTFESKKIQSALVAALCSFGGFSAYFQTAGILKKCGLSGKNYLFFKSISGLICFTLNMFIT